MKTHNLLLVIFLCLFIMSCSNSINNDIKHDLDKPILSESEIINKKLTPEILWKFGRLGEYDVSKNGKKIVYIIKFYSVEKNRGNSSLYLHYLDSDSIYRLTDTSGSEFNPRFHPISDKVGFLSTRSGSTQIWEIDLNSLKITQKSDIKNGINSFEYSPKGDKILYTKDVKLDSSTLDIHPDMPKANVRIINELMYRHWDSWHDYKYSHIFITDNGSDIIDKGIDILAGEKVDSPLPPFYDYSQITWDATGERIAYTAKKMTRDEAAISTNSDIYIYDLNSKETANITATNLGYDRHPVFSPNGEMIIWESMETPGYEADKERLMLYNFTTKETSYLTSDFDQNVTDLTWDNKGELIYFISGINATYQIYNIDIKTRKIIQLTNGLHNYQSFIKTNEIIIGKKMSMSMASELFKIDLKNNSESQVTKINNDIYDNIEFGKVEKRIIKTTNNKDMLTWVIYPPNFDVTKKYPTILYCQGGPQSAVSQFFSYRWNFQIMAANGYIIVAPNRHGLPTFGQEWNDQIAGDYGGQNMKDYLQAIDVMSKEPFVDETKLGAIGASYGGYSVFYLAGIHQGRFKAFISHCGVFNLESMYAATEETFFPHHDLEGAYWETPKPKSYSYSPHLKVQNWDTPIMIIVGEHDYRIPYPQSLAAFNAAKFQGIPAKLLFFSDETHWVLKPQNAIIWQREFYKWLDQWLKE